MNKLKAIYNFFQGKKVYIIGVCGVIYGLGTGDNTLILGALGMMGLRDGLNTVVAKILLGQKKK